MSREPSFREYLQAVVVSVVAASALAALLVHGAHAPANDPESADAASEADPYLAYTLSDGRAAVLFRGDPSELRDARIALDIMAKRQPGLMPAIYGSTRLANGEPALVLERFEEARVAADGPQPFLEPYRAVFTPRAYEDWKASGGFGRALDNDYVFLDAAGRPRLALPRRASQFRELVESGRVFQDHSTITPP